MRLMTFTLAVLAVLLQVACAGHHEKPAPYPPTDSYSGIFTGMEQARERAIAQGKLLLHVMGANWCHDSVGFVSKTETPEFAALISERYVVNLINVGELEYVREVITRYGEPVIYGTPTVLVVEPVSDTLLNRTTLPYWRNADAISLDDTLAYFSAFEPGQAPAVEPEYSPALKRAMTDIEDFENRQAERIYIAYAELGALLRASEAGDTPPGFMDKWGNLAEMRGRITDDLERLRLSAKQQAAQGVDPIALEFPEYDLFIDREAD